MRTLLYKTPDYEGGFIHYYLENYNIVRETERGNILEITPVNALQKGQRIRDGIIKEIGKEKIKLRKGIETFEVNRDIANRYILQKALEGKENIEIPLTFPERLVNGTFETELGKIEVDSIPENTRLTICEPDEIKQTERGYILQKAIGNRKQTIELTKSITGKLKIWDVKEKEIKKASQKPKAFRKAVSLKNIFKFPTGDKLNAEPKKPVQSTGTAWNVKGGVKPTHKYIERRPHPTKPDQYIYLYELPSGKKVWRDKEGKEVNEPQEGKQNEEQGFKPGDKILYNAKEYEVVEQGNKLLAVKDKNGKTLVIDIEKNIQDMIEQMQAQIGDEIEINGKKVKIRDKTDNIIVYQDENGLDFIPIAKPIEKIENKEPESREENTDYTLDRERDVLLGYHENDEWKMRNYDYEKQPEYNIFELESKKQGYGKVNDLRYRKQFTFETGFEHYPEKSQLWILERSYDPASQTTSIKVDGSDKFAIKYGDDNFRIFDINDKGFYVKRENEVNKPNADMYFIPKEDYYDYLKDEIDHVTKTTEQEYGNYIIEDVKEKEKNTYHFSGELDPEVQKLIDENKRTRSRAKKLTPEELQKKIQDVKEMREQQEREKAQMKEALNSQEFITFREQTKGEGYEPTENPFRFTKKVNIHGGTYEFTKVYDWQDGTAHVIPGTMTYEDVEIGGRKLPIQDIIETEKGKYDIYFKDGDEIKKISTDELRELNGKTLFRNTLGSRGLVSKREPQFVYFTPQVKELATWEVVDIDDLLISHDLEGNFNQKYRVKEAQNRDRKSKESKDQVERISKDFGENWITFSPSASIWSDGGAPVVSNDYMVIAGNGRAMGMLKHYQEKGKDYKENLIKHAKDLGFNPEEIKKIKHPVIVRRFGNLPESRIIELGGLSNDPRSLSVTKFEQGKSKAVRIDNETYKNIAQLFNEANKYLPEGGTIAEYLDVVGGDIVDKLVDKGVILPNEIANYYDYINKRMNTDQKDMLKHVILEKTFGDDSKYIPQMRDKTVKGISDALGTIMTLKGTPADISEPIGKAFYHIARYQNNENYVSPDDYVSSEANNMVQPISADPKTLAIFETLADKKQTEIRNLIKQYALETQGDMFMEAKDPETAFWEVFHTKYPEGINLNKSLFAQLRKALDKTRLMLSPSKKNPMIRRWQKVNEPVVSFKNKDTAVQLDLFSDSYITQDGELINFKQGNKLKPILRPLKKGETCLVERRYSAYKSMDFTGKDRIESPEDVAYIFRGLSDKSIENAFVLHETEKGLIIQHISQGNDVASIFTGKPIIDAIERFGTKKVWLIHNHPSGNLNPSNEDISRTESFYQNIMKKRGIEFGGHIIIDAEKKQYALIKIENYTKDLDIPENGSNKKIKAVVYDRQSYNFDADYYELFKKNKINNPDSLVELLRKLRFDLKNSKYMLITFRNDMHPTGLFYLGTDPTKDETKFKNEIEDLTIRSAGVNSIIIARAEKGNLDMMRNIIGDINDNRTIKIVDYIEYYPENKAIVNLGGRVVNR